MSVAFGVGAGGRPLLASGGYDGTVRLWDPATSTPVGQPLTGHTEALTSVAFGVGADGRPLLASASWDGTVRLWDPTTGAEIAALRRRSAALSVTFAGEAVAIGDEEGLSVVEVAPYY
jgi:WD40 repeat protein